MASIVQLGDLVRIEKGKKASQVFERLSANTRRYLQIDDLRPDAKRKFVEPFACPVASKSDVVIAWDGANAGTVSCNLDGYIGSTLAVLRPSTQQLFAPYLSRFLEGKFDYLQKNSTGATVPHVSRDVLDSLELPLPNLIEQRRIAAQLEQADRLRRTCRYALELSDSFLPAAFLELFGDPLENPKGYKVEELGGLFQTPPGLGTTKPCEPGGNLRCVRVGEVGFGGINLDACGFVNLSESERRRFMVETGDILLARAIGSEGHLGKLSICQPHTEILTFDSHLMRVRVNLSRLLPQFLATLLWSSGGRHLFMRQARRTAVQFNINAEQMSELAIPLPPLDQQQKFAALVERHEHLRATQREALRQAEHLFQTLLHRAFSAGG